MPSGGTAGRRDRRGATRTWGDWTVVKLDALGRYLPAFTTASKRAGLTLYLDLFSGSTENTHRDTGEVLRGSAARALAATPEFDRVVLSELDPTKAQRLREYVAAHHPDRDVVVLHGDCNEVIPTYLHSLSRGDVKWRRAAVFAFVDQYSADVTWPTLRALASFRVGSRKTELWLYFGDSFIPRGLSTGEEYARRVDDMYGSTDWRPIYHEGRTSGVLEGGQAQKELVNLMRWRLENELGYGRTIPLRVTRSSGHGLYTMIFATDHRVGEKIMTQVLGVAEGELHELQKRQKRSHRLARRDAEAGGGGFDVLVDWADGLPVEGVAPERLLLLDEPHPPWSPEDRSGD